MVSVIGVAMVVLPRAILAWCERSCVYLSWWGDVKGMNTDVGGGRPDQQSTAWRGVL